MQHVHIGAPGADELQVRRDTPPHVFESDVFRSQQRVHQVEHIKADAAAVDASERVAHLVDFELLIEFDVCDPVIVQHLEEMVLELATLLKRHVRPFVFSRMASRIGLITLLFPERLVVAEPVADRPLPLISNDRQREHLVGKLSLPVSEQVRTSACPVLNERLVGFIISELVDADEVEVTNLSLGRRTVGCHEGVVHRAEPLLAVKHDVLGVALTIVSEALQWLACE